MGIIHRDIKPDNIILRPNDSPVLIDFGSARQFAEAETRELTAVLTPGFAPIEQYYRNSKPQGPWTDIYSLAGVAFYCCTGNAPVEAPRRVGMRHNGSPDPQPILDVVAFEKLSPELCHAINSGLQINRSERPQSVADFVQLLHGTECASGIRLQESPSRIRSQIAKTIEPTLLKCPTVFDSEAETGQRPGVASASGRRFAPPQRKTSGVKRTGWTRAKIGWVVVVTLSIMLGGYFLSEDRMSNRMSSEHVDRAYVRLRSLDGDKFLYHEEGTAYVGYAAGMDLLDFRSHWYIQASATPDRYWLINRMTGKSMLAGSPSHRRTSTILVDFGGDNTHRGASVSSPDRNGNYWNEVGYSPALNVVDTDNNSTAIDIHMTSPFGNDSYNGPSGITSDPATSDYNASALGELSINPNSADFGSENKRSH